MRRLLLFPALVVGIAVGWFAKGAVALDTHDDTSRALVAQLEAMRSELSALRTRPNHITVGQAQAPAACPPTTTAETAPEEPEELIVDRALSERADRLVRDAIAGRRWTDAHRDQWVAMQANLDTPTR